MKKTIRIILSLLGVVIVVVLGIIFGIQAYKARNFDYVHEKSLEYLCEKYDAQPEEFELVYYNQAHYTQVEVGFLDYEKVWVDFSFEYVYKDRHFVVSRNKNGFYDDYQFDDIQKWCTEWLQKNADERIVGINFNTNNIINFYENTGYDFSYVLSKKDAKKFLLNYTNKDEFVHIYFFDLYYTDDDIKLYNEELCEKVNNTLGDDLICGANYTQERPSKRIDRIKDGNWDTWTELK